MKKFHIAKDMLYVISELSSYLESKDEVNKRFLEMIVGILCIKNLHSHNKHNDDLLSFSIRCMTKLIPKVSDQEFDLKMAD